MKIWPKKCILGSNPIDLHWKFQLCNLEDLGLDDPDRVSWGDLQCGVLSSLQKENRVFPNQVLLNSAVVIELVT